MYLFCNNFRKNKNFTKRSTKSQNHEHFSVKRCKNFTSQSSITDHRRRDQHLGGRRGASHLKRHQSRRQKDDGIRHRRRDRRASQQTGEAGIGDTGEVYPPPLAAKPAQPAPPPPPKPVPPPLWLSGQLPANQRGNTQPRGQLRGGRGNIPQRGGHQGQTRTAPPRGGNRGGPRGGRPGRWGRW